MDQRLEQIIHAGRAKALQGKVATYIPELGKVDGRQLGICIFTKAGDRFSAGDAAVPFSIQSISKVINLAIALQLCGFDRVFQNVGMEPSGDCFNSLIKLEHGDHTPYNPMINAGAIVIASYLVCQLSFDEMLRRTRALCLDQTITLDEQVYQSEMSTISRNRAIAYLLESKGYMQADVESSLSFYVKMCSLRVTTQSLAGLGLVLANNGIHPETQAPLLSAHTVQVVKTIMLMCGMYDGSGEFAVRVGLASKSGVGGGILSLVDGEMGIGIFGPALDEKGNSVAGRFVLEQLSHQLNLHMFSPLNRPFCLP